MLKALREIHNPTSFDPDTPPRPTLPHTDSQEVLLPRASTASEYGTRHDDEEVIDDSLKSAPPSEIAPQTAETEGSKNGKSSAGKGGKKGKKSKQLSIA
jgi:hypothetical protein